MVAPNTPPLRALHLEDFASPRLVYVVWEVTMKCDQPCQHCGSRAGRSRTSELDTDEVLEVARSIGRLGCKEVALIGGEAYLRPDLEAVITELVRAGTRVIMQTGGRGLSLERIRQLRDAGLTQLGVSVDGPAPVHDRLRGNLGSHQAALRALDFGREAGLITSANSQINRLNWNLLEETCTELRSHGIQAWQVQLTVPMGRAADHPEWILEPRRIVDVIDTLAKIQREAIRDHRGDGIPFNVFANNNVGYFGPHEQVIRSRPGGADVHWKGCRAGINLLGVESDGTIKACPSLPTAPYAGGSVRDLTLERIWETSPQVAFARDRDESELWGFCSTCYYADVCRAGCSFTAHCTLGRRGNNPFCYHRATTLRKRGVREKLVHVERPAGDPYHFGRFEVVEEPWTDDEPDEHGPAPRRQLPLLG